VPVPRWHPLLWLLYPVAYVIFVLIRGESTHSYPYGFIDANQLSGAELTRNVVGLLIIFTAMGYVLRAIGRRVRVG